MFTAMYAVIVLQLERDWAYATKICSLWFQGR
jgi:hypothetical protein